MSDIIFGDISTMGELDANGDIKIVTGVEALNQAFQNWVLSSKGERLNGKNGGYLLPHLKKPMNEDRVGVIKQSIMKGLEEDFLPKLEILKLDVIPDYQRKTWNIRLIAYSPDVKLGVNSDIQINNLV